MKSLTYLFLVLATSTFFASAQQTLPNELLVEEHLFLAETEIETAEAFASETEDLVDDINATCSG